MKIFTRTLEITLTVFLVLLSGFRYQLENTEIRITTIIIVVMAVAAYIVARVFKKEYDRTPEPSHIYVLYILTVVTSVVHAFYIPAALLELYLHLIAWFIFLGVYNLAANGYPIKRLENAALITGGIYVLLKLGQIVTGLAARVSTCSKFLLLPNKTAAFTTLVILLSLAVMINRRGRAKYLIGANLAGAIIVLLLTGSRGGLVAAWVSVSFMLIIYKRQEIIKTSWAMIAFIIVDMFIIAAVTIAIGRPAECMALRPEAAAAAGLPLVSNNPAWDQSIITRWELFKYAFTLFTRRPILGYGPGNFTILAAPAFRDNYKVTIHAHNIYLNTIAERGIIGLASLAAVSVYMALELIKSKNYLAAAALAAIISIAVQGMADVVTIEPFIMRYFYIILALGLSTTRKEKANEKSTI